MEKMPGQIDDKSKRLLEVIKKYGKLSAVPAEELTVLGYEPDTSGISKKGKKQRLEVQIKQEEEKHKNKKQKNLQALQEIKASNVPFEKIEILANEQDTAGRYFGSDAYDSLRSQCQQVEYALYGNDFLSLSIPSDNSFWVVKEKFEEFTRDQKVSFPEENKVVTKMLDYLAGSDLVTNFKGIFEQLDVPEILRREFRYEHDVYSLSSKSAEKVYHEILQMEGLAYDENNFHQYYLEYLNLNAFDWIKESGSEIENLDKVEAVFKKRNFKTFEDLMMSYWRKFFVDQELDCFISPEDKTFEAVIKKLKAVKLIDFEESTELKTIKMELKTSSPEEKKKLSKRGKDLKEKLKQKMIIVTGIIEMMSPYQFFVSFLKKYFKELKAKLVRKNSEYKNVEVILDGRMDFELDQNPGRVSGDCTSERPLPFMSPKVPVFNVKVFGSQKGHIGNIYLYDIKNYLEQKVWHLEAIQVPSEFDWDEFIDKIFKQMGIEAEKKGIKMITVNEKPHHISNYDYISSAVLKYSQKYNFKTTIVTYPPVASSPAYSRPQGDGRALVVWQAEDLKSSKQ